MMHICIPFKYSTAYFSAQTPGLGAAEHFTSVLCCAPLFTICMRLVSAAMTWYPIVNVEKYGGHGKRFLSG